MTDAIPAPPWVVHDLIAHRRKHRVVFAAAGAYNIAWGGFTIVEPQWLFRLAGMKPANYPQIFATLGMVIGLYGILYLSVAAYPEHGWLSAAVGLAGKLLGPVGLAGLVLGGRWPPATIVICLANDIVWWVPFVQYLRDATSVRPTRALRNRSRPRQPDRAAPGAGCSGRHQTRRRRVPGTD